VKKKKMDRGSVSRMASKTIEAVPAVSQLVSSVSPPLDQPTNRSGWVGVPTVGLKVLNIGHAVGLGDDNPKKVD